MYCRPERKLVRPKSAPCTELNALSSQALIHTRKQARHVRRPATCAVQASKTQECGIPGRFPSGWDSQRSVPAQQ
eukprot:6173790-Pleurochrysis_carterae.AAC.2